MSLKIFSIHKLLIILQCLTHTTIRFHFLRSQIKECDTTYHTIILLHESVNNGKYIFTLYYFHHIPLGSLFLNLVLKIHFNSYNYQELYLCSKIIEHVGYNSSKYN
jgi:hypothetical protein